MLSIKLERLFCYVTQERKQDEILLKYNGKRLWPENKYSVSIAQDKSVDLNVSIDHIADGQEILLELWEHDTLSANDLLGRFIVLADKPGGPFKTDIIKNPYEKEKVKYTLQWKLE